MKKSVAIIIFLFIVCFPIAGKEKIYDVIYLKTGEKYIGEIVLHTEQVVMIQTYNGKKYQFLPSEISEIKKESLFNGSEQTNEFDGNIVALLQLGGGISTIKGAFNSQPHSAISISLGNKNTFGKNLYVGAGIGYNTIFDSFSEKTLSFLPAFIQFKNIFSNTTISPSTNVKFGYAFPLQSYYSGGVFLNTSAGLNIQTTQKTNIFIGINVQWQYTYGNISEEIFQNTYTSKNNAVMSSYGITTAFVF